MLKHTYLKLVEMQEEQAKRHLEEVRVIHSEMRGYKHDFHHHLQALKGQLEAGEVERALAYIEQLESRAAPVQHGYWIIPTPPDNYTYCKIVCSACNQVAGKHQTEYCPRCGAKMDLPRPRSNSDD